MENLPPRPPARRRDCRCVTDGDDRVGAASGISNACFWNESVCLDRRWPDTAAAHLPDPSTLISQLGYPIQHRQAARPPSAWNALFKYSRANAPREGNGW
ncbi:hypothetical protein Dda_2169 [Drechslerella dactyloides]|uniref:Uncharacterized protein n=1 Tax=Drechslerella dactyloides TaxID=74499 RepID=A0AAD6J3X6_DREDA|nr:hypothetical protein Dda_2169 [Drechslerella dactyloides]